MVTATYENMTGKMPSFSFAATDSNKIEVIVLDDQKSRELRRVQVIVLDDQKSRELRRVQNRAQLC